MNTKQPKQPEIIMGEVTTYKGCFIMPIEINHVVGFDVVDRRTGKWAHYPSRRLARWTASVWTRLNTEFTAYKPIPADVRKEWAAQAAINEIKAKGKGKK